MQEVPEGDELHPAVDVPRCCKKNSPESVLSYIGKRTIKAAPTSHRLIMVMQSLPLNRKMGQNVESNSPEGFDHLVNSTHTQPIPYYGKQTFEVS